MDDSDYRRRRVTTIEEFAWHPEHDPPDWARHLAHKVIERLDCIMASIQDLTAAVGAATDAFSRIDADFQKLQDTLTQTHLDDADQAAVDQAVSDLAASVAAGNAVDPAPVVTPPDDGGATTPPADDGSGGTVTPPADDGSGTLPADGSGDGTAPVDDGSQPPA